MTFYILYLPGCFTEGGDLTEALANAKDCLASYLEAEYKIGAEVPPPSDFITAKEKAIAHYKKLGFEPNPNTFYQAITCDLIFEKPRQIAISMRPALLAAIDRHAKVDGMTRSAFLAAAARYYMQRA